MTQDFLARWRPHLVEQRNKETGCIPWSYELLARQAGVDPATLATFQEDFDCGERNDFAVVANAVRAKRPELVFTSQPFPRGNGIDKLRLVRDRDAQGLSTVVSIPMSPFVPNADGKYHIMPVLDAGGGRVVLLYGVVPQGAATLTISHDVLVSLHDTHDGGHEVAFLDLAGRAP